MKTCLVIKILKEPIFTSQLTMQDWDILIRQARRAGLLARLYYICEINNCIKYMPEKVLNHFLSDWVLYQKQIISVKREVFEVKKFLEEQGISFSLMKGAAYVLLDLEVSKGRMFSDIDLIVSKSCLDEAEKALMNAGWMGTHHNEYDRKYYRKWMHEIPPLKHVQRQTVLDVHHNILPLTVKNKIDENKILDRSMAHETGKICTLCHDDLVIHSAAHLFHEGEFFRGLRDISDLDLLLREFGGCGDFWFTLLNRAKELKLGRELFYAVRYAKKILDTPIPDSFLINLESEKPNWILIWLLDNLFLRALMPEHSSCNDSWTGFSRWVLYIRSHWLRMPFYLLLPHLSRKAWMRLIGKESH